MVCALILHCYFTLKEFFIFFVCFLICFLNQIYYEIVLSKVMIYQFDQFTMYQNGSQLIKLYYNFLFIIHENIQYVYNFH